MEVLNRDIYQTPQGKIFMTDDDGLRKLAEEVMISNKGRLKHCDLNSITFVVVEGDKGEYLAKAIKIPPLYRLFLKGKKFIILFNALRLENSPDRPDIVMLHELTHCNTDLDCIVDHDTEDFRFMLKEFGMDWKTAGQNIVTKEKLVKLVPWAMSGATKTASGQDKATQT